MSEAWIYIDESQGPAANAVDSGKPFHVGALFVERVVPEDLINRALAKLADDPEAKHNDMDQRTLSRRYFHASCDSKNAHSWLSREIVAAPIDGTFYDTQWHFGRGNSSEFGPGELHGLMNILAAVPVAHDDYDAVHLVIAKREGTFDEANTAGWEARSRTGLLEAFVRQPNIPTRFPRIMLDLVGGENPGIQVCDLILWAIQRAGLNQLIVTGNDDWLRRLCVNARAGHGEVGGAQEGVSLVVGAGVDRPFMPDMSGGIPRLLEELGGPECLREVMREIEAEVHRCAAMAADGNPRIAHLASELTHAVTLLSNRPRENDMVRVAQAFLLVCDTLPTYDPADAAGYVRVVERRRVAAAVANQSDIRWSNMARFWSTSR